MQKEEQTLQTLPKAFLSRMKEMLGTEYEDFLESYQEKRTFGLRVNTQKISCEEFEQIVPFPVKKIPWVENGYFYEEESHPARCPLYQAGLYYLQEPSAMTPASRIPIIPGDFVLDLCAAPGGKATALGAALAGEGLLVANDISASRAKALLRNLELFGISNALVTNETPEKLLARFPGFFNKIILDAPCSGEGMFRKEEALARDWTPEKSEALAETQRRLILQAADMLAPGGMLLYSTCTFAPIEDEGTISWLLTNRPEMALTDIRPYEGFTPGNPAWGNGDPTLSKCVRIFPHKMPGEGHFLALLRKSREGANTKDSLSDSPYLDSANTELPKSSYSRALSSESNAASFQNCSGQLETSFTQKDKLQLPKNNKAVFSRKSYMSTPDQRIIPDSSRKAYINAPNQSKNRKSRATSEAQSGLFREYRALLESFFTEIGLKTLGGHPFGWSRVEIRADRAYYLPPVTPDVRGLNFLRCGLYLGDFKKNRFEPSEPLALALHKADATAALRLPVTDPRLTDYLRGNPIPVTPEESPSSHGWHLLCAESYPLAFGKLVNTTLKNKYPTGWRI